MDKILSLLKNFLTGENSNPSEIKTVDIKCIAIDQSGNLGSFYNKYQDAILGKVNDKVKSYLSLLNDGTICRLYHGRTAETQNLLEMVGIERTLRLSIILKMIQPTGIASIINYPRSIDKYTRFIYFRHESRKESCHKDLIKSIQQRKLRNLDTDATHIITQIVWGVHAVVVLQLLPNQEVEIDPLLEEICHNLIHDEHRIEMKSKQRALLDQIISTTIYSNIPTLSGMTKLDDIWQRMLELKKNSTEHRRLKYTLSPIQSLYPEQNTNNPFNKSEIETFENELVQQLSELRVLQLRLDHELPELLQGKLEERLISARQSFTEMKKLHDNTMQQIGNFLVRLRQRQAGMNSFSEELNSDVQGTMNAYTRRLIITLDGLTLKGDLIKKLQNEGFEYSNVATVGIDKECSEQLVQDILFKNNSKKLIFCSTDNLKQQSEEQWNALYSQILKNRQKDPQFTLVYADFTYSTRRLEEMVILSSKEQITDRCETNSNGTLSRRKGKAPSPPLTSNDEYINILLLGESGVGKSTFINAFANYLRYDTLDEAQSSKPFVIIPVTFLMTINDDFEEKLVKFGDADPNEDHSNSGQSVTQQCRSYVFEISHEKKLRIIDTPGFGDTRGNNQDDLNMEMIFTFVNHLPYLNGVCLLFKPNEAQLNPFLYSCCTQLFRCFGENIREHFIFCFTNARSTFFAPGDTGPLLKSFFDAFPVRNIQLKRKNTFCFDSESFRYLVALQRSLIFNELEKDEFDKSWTRSVEESKRFRDYLCIGLRQYRKNIEWQSEQDACCQINSMSRPMLETMRNILRNILLHSIHSVIKLKSTCVIQATVICYAREGNMEKFGQCWILLDHLHPSSHQCTSNQHGSVTYRLDYEYLADQTNESTDILNQQQTVLLKAAAIFASFLMRTQARQDDPFLSDLTRMIKDEKKICEEKNPSNFNQQLVNELGKLEKEYKQFFDIEHSDGNNKELSNIYELIRAVNEIPMVNEQMNTIKKYQQFLLTSSEQHFCEETTRF